MCGIRLVRDVQQVRLDDVELREDDVERRVEDLPDGVFLKPCPNEKVQISRNALMLRVW